MKALRADGYTHRIFNIGTGKGSTLEAAAEVLRKAVPDAKIEIGPGTDYGTGSGRYCIFDISRARGELDYEPEFDHEAGILDYLGELQAKGA